MGIQWTVVEDTNETLLYYAKESKTPEKFNVDKLLIPAFSNRKSYVVSPYILAWYDETTLIIYIIVLIVFNIIYLHEDLRLQNLMVYKRSVALNCMIFKNLNRG